MKATYRRPGSSTPKIRIPGVGKVVEELDFLSLTLDVHGNTTDMMVGYTAVSSE